MIGIETTRKIYEYFTSNKLDPIKTIRETNDDKPKECEGRSFKVKCVNGLTYRIIEINGEIEKVERIQK